MDGTKLKESWICHYCHDSLEEVVVVPDQASLVEQLRSFGVRPDIPAQPIEKPKIYELPKGYSDPGDSWTCSCMKYFSPQGGMHDLNVTVYLDYQKYIAAIGLASKKEEHRQIIFDNGEEESENQTSLDNEAIIQALLANEDADSSNYDSSCATERDDNTQDEILSIPIVKSSLQSKREPVYCPGNENESVSMQYRNAFSLLEIDEDVTYDSDASYNSGVSNLAHLHGRMSDDTSIRSYEINSAYGSETDSKTYLDLDSLIKQTCKEQGITDLNDLNSDIGSSATDFEKILEEMEPSSQRSNSSRGRKKANINSEVDALADKMMMFTQTRYDNPAKTNATPHKKEPEIVLLSSDNDDEVGEEKKSKRKRRLPRHKDVSIIDLEAMGLNEEKDNYVTLGEVPDYESCVQTVIHRESHNEWLEVKSLRSVFRKVLQDRVEQNRREPPTDSESLVEENRKYVNELKDLYERKTQLERLERKCTTNPVENSLLTFAHPQKIHGTSLLGNEGIISPYKLALSEDEVNFPDEWSEDLPFKGYYHVRQLYKNSHISNILNKCSDPANGKVKHRLKETISLIKHSKEKKSCYSVGNEHPHLNASSKENSEVLKQIPQLREEGPPPTQATADGETEEAADLFFDI